MRPVKGKTYQDHTFALSIFHLSLMMTILITSRWNIILDCSSLAKTCKLLPHTPMREPLIWASLHISIITLRMVSFKHMISSKCSSWTCTSFLHYVDVLKIHIRAHSIFVFKTYLLCDQLSHDQTSDYSLNSTLVSTWSSSFSSYFNLDTNIWFKHCLWT